MIAAGIAFGLLSSIALGVGDLSAGLLARRLGTLRVAAGELALSLVLLLVLIRIAGLGLPSDPHWVSIVAGIAALRTFGYFALIRAFSFGPVAVVGPITAGNSAATVVAAMLLLGDRPSPLQLVAVVVATVGSLLIVLVVDRPNRRLRLSGRGPMLAIVAMVCLATVVAAQQPPIRALGWLPMIALRRGFEVAITWSILVIGWLLAPAAVGLVRRPWSEWSRRGRAPRPPASRAPSPLGGWAASRSARFLVAIAVFDTVGLSSLAVALQVAPAWLFGIVGSVGPVVAVTYGMVFLGERLKPVQWLGIAFVLLALVLVGLG